MRKPVVPWALASLALGAGLAAVSVLAGYRWSQDDRVTTFDGGYSYTALQGRPYSSSFAITFDTDWAGVLVPAAVGGAIIGLLVGWLLPRLARRAGSLLAGSAVFGAALGLIGVVAAYGWHRYDTSGESFARRYVDYLPLPPVPEWTGLLLPAAVTGAVLGLVLGVLAYVVVRRSSRRAARSA